MYRKLLFIFLFSMPLIASAQAVKYSNEFLDIGVGARGLAMSNSINSTVDDITSVFYNPAGLAKMEDKMHIDFMHASYFAGILNYDFGGIAFKVGRNSGNMGLSLVRFGADNIPNTFELIDNNGQVDYSRVQAFSAVDYAFFVTYANQHRFRRYGHKELRYGGNMKIVRRVVGSFGGSWGFGFDAAIQYSYNKWNFGVMAKDITTTVNAWSFSFTDQQKQVLAQTGNDIPSSSIEITQPRVIGGASRNFELSDKFSILVELGGDITFDGKRNVPISTSLGSIDPHLGFELGYRKLIFFRGGLGNFQAYTSDDASMRRVIGFQPNIGAGFKLNKLVVDYAFTDLGNQTVGLYSNIISVKYIINDNRRIR